MEKFSINHPYDLSLTAIRRNGKSMRVASSSGNTRGSGSHKLQSLQCDRSAPRQADYSAHGRLGLSTARLFRTEKALAAFGRLSGECPQTRCIVATLCRRTEMSCSAVLDVAWRWDVWRVLEDICTRLFEVIDAGHDVSAIHRKTQSRVIPVLPDAYLVWVCVS